MKKKQYLFIICYGLIIVTLFLGFNHLYGANVDWINQHTVFPDIFRNLFYETGKFIPNLLFNLGGGQNIYNFSYYGLLSPIILLSYYLPFIPMVIYVQIASVILYILTGVLMAKFIDDKFNNSRYAVISGIIILSFAAINFHFHHHIMFVWYFPFLLLALMGIDKYFNSKNSVLLIISLFLIIMTNYYYSVTALIVVFLYGVYKIIDKSNKFSTIILDTFKLGLRFIIPVFMTMIILLPTLYCLKNGARSGRGLENILLLFRPLFSEVFYQNSSLSLIGIFLIAIIGNLCFKNNKKSDIFLNISLLSVLLFPVFMYLLNGGLYIRGKVLLPFVPLIIYSFIKFFDSLLKDKINIRKLVYFVLVVSLFAVVCNIKNILFLVDILISLILICYVYKKKKEKLLIYFVINFMLIVSIINNICETYITLDKYREVNNENIKELFDKVDDLSFHRSLNLLDSKDTINKVYNSNYYSPAIYSSTYNSKYLNFYNFMMGNNIKHRNILMTNGTDNELFFTYMGVKYIVSKKDPGLYYEKVVSQNGYNLYSNSSSYPILYLSDQFGNNNELDKLSFPYNIEYLMNKTVVSNDDGDSSYKTKIKEYKNNSLDKDYEFNLDKTYEKNIKLPNELTNKILYISFDMLYNQNCTEGDTKITINGVENKLTCKEWKYHNENNNFTYVISLENSSELNLIIDKGKYKIGKIKIYYSDKIGDNKKEINNIHIRKKDSIIEGKVKTDRERYVVSSIPYDEGFRVFVDGKQVKNEIVNNAFLGFKVSKGNHSIMIKYESPGYKYGIILSIIGFGCFLMLIGFELKSKYGKNR